MTPEAIISNARAEGVDLALTHAGTIRATGNTSALGRWVPIIRDQKAALVAFLRSVADVESFEERAAIREYLGGYPRIEAEFLARLDVSRMKAH